MPPPPPIRLYLLMFARLLVSLRTNPPLAIVALMALLVFVLLPCVPLPRSQTFRPILLLPC